MADVLTPLCLSTRDSQGQGCRPKQHRSPLGAHRYKEGEERKGPWALRCAREGTRRHHHHHSTTTRPTVSVDVQNWAHDCQQESKA